LAAQAQSAAERLEDRGVDGTLDDLRGYARRHPGMFLAGAFAIGVVGGRVLRNMDTEVLTNTTSRSSDSASQPQQLEGPDIRSQAGETAIFVDIEESAPAAADFLPGRPAGGGEMP